MFAVVTKDVYGNSQEEPPKEIGFGLLDPSKVVKFYFNKVVVGELFIPQGPAECIQGPTTNEGPLAGPGHQRPN